MRNLIAAICFMFAVSPLALAQDKAKADEKKAAPAVTAPAPAKAEEKKAAPAVAAPAPAKAAEKKRHLLQKRRKSRAKNSWRNVQK